MAHKKKYTIVPIPDRMAHPHDRVTPKERNTHAYLGLGHTAIPRHRPSRTVYGAYLFPDTLPIADASAASGLLQWLTNEMTRVRTRSLAQPSPPPDHPSPPTPSVECTCTTCSHAEHALNLSGNSQNGIDKGAQRARSGIVLSGGGSSVAGDRASLATRRAVRFMG